MKNAVTTAIDPSGVLTIGTSEVLPLGIHVQYGKASILSFWHHFDRSLAAVLSPGTFPFESTLLHECCRSFLRRSPFG